ncbi:MAG: ComEC/Rec2 family competence protein, partial [Qipengyuania sp.]
DFLAPREESGLRRFLRRTAILFLTGLVIELALMPIVLFHFHRAGVYGAAANLVAIPLVTFVSMPLVALALALDLVGAGAPVWWLVGQSLDLLLGIAHLFAEQPGSVKLAPRIGMGVITLYLVGALWLALWQGRARLWGIGPVVVAAVLMLQAPVPDILITRDGRDIGIANEAERLLVLRDSEGGYAQENLLELAGTDRQPLAIAEWPRSRCSAEFCSLTVTREGRAWSLLIARSRDLVEERALAQPAGTPTSSLRIVSCPAVVARGGSRPIGVSSSERAGSRSIWAHGVSTPWRRIRASMAGGARGRTGARPGISDTGAADRPACLAPGHGANRKPAARKSHWRGRG